MTLYTNCEKFHCSMKRSNDEIPALIVCHLTITRKAKYSKINNNIDICQICSFDKNVCDASSLKKARIED
jgi:hypothetical protein